MVIRITWWFAFPPLFPFSAVSARRTAFIITHTLPHQLLERSEGPRHGGNGGRVGYQSFLFRGMPKLSGVELLKSPPATAHT